MRNVLAALVLMLWFSFGTQAQGFTEKELTGTWKVTKVETTLSPELAENLAYTIDLMKSQFDKARFSIGADKNFTLAISPMVINKAHWKFSGTNTIVVQEWQNKDTDKGIIMTIELKKEGKKTYFIIPAMTALLEVVKE